MLHTDIVWKAKGEVVKIERQPQWKRPIHIQVVHTERKVLISKQAFLKYLRRENIQVHQVIEGLINFFQAKEMQLALGAGTGLWQAQEAVMEIPVPPGLRQLEGILLKTQKIIQ